MAEHHDEMEQVEELKRWWLENRAFVLAGLVIGVGAVAGWRGWEWHQTRMSEQGAALYAEVATAIESKDLAKAEGLGLTLRNDYAGTPYAANAALLLAKAELDAGQGPAARLALEWVIAEARDAEIKVLARTRLARLLIADGEASKALELLAGIDGGAFVALAQDARGDAHAALGHPEDARKSWQAALDASEGNLADRAMIELKIDALGPATTPTTPAATAATAPASAPTTTKPAGTTP